MTLHLSGNKPSHAFLRAGHCPGASCNAVVTNTCTAVHTCQVMFCVLCVSPKTLWSTHHCHPHFVHWKHGPERSQSHWSADDYSRTWPGSGLSSCICSPACRQVPSFSLIGSFVCGWCYLSSCENHIRELPASPPRVRGKQEAESHR